ncbi:MAG TPA: amidohydrolase, partial [Thermodesulfobacteriota bacterium]|nr:amidohydrolase [Thermodesulfobacteriota bacterium]
MLIRARWVVPVEGAPVEHGAVRVEAGRIVALGPQARGGGEGLAPEPGEPVVELGEAALLPGLVDAHSHLEWTALRGALDG